MAEEVDARILQTHQDLIEALKARINTYLDYEEDAAISPKHAEMLMSLFTQEKCWLSEVFSNIYAEQSRGNI